MGMREPPHLGKDLYKGMVQFVMKDPASVLIDWGKKRILKGTTEGKGQGAITKYRTKTSERAKQARATAKARKNLAKT